MARKTLWFFDCDMGQGAVEASTYEAARKEAILDAGRDSGVRNVHKPTQAEIAWRAGIGGWMPPKYRPAA